MDISSNNVTVENAGALTGNPAVNITGSGVTFVNKAGASVIGYPAIAIRGQGVKIVNEAGALIRGAPDPRLGYDFLAIDGSTYSDIVINYGKIANDIELHGGDDRYEVFVTAENNVLGNPLADLGDGDDVAIFHLDGIADLLGVEAIPGAGYDTLRFEGITQSSIRSNIADHFERVEFVGTGQPSSVSVNYMSGVQEFALSSNLTLTLGYSPTRSRNPTATVSLNGGHLELGYTHTIGAVVGTDAGEIVKVIGTILGDVATGGGEDLVFVRSEAWGGSVYGAGSIAGKVSLGAGDDVFALGGLDHARAGTVAGIVDGGEGYDRLQLYAHDGRTIALSKFTGFEHLSIEGGLGGDIRVTELQLIPAVVLTVSEGGRVVIGDTQAPELVLQLHAYSRTSQLTIEADATIGGITRSIPLHYGLWGGSPDLALTVRNAGVITGDVHLWAGNDYFDNRSGSVGGIILGLGGDDVILLGAGSGEADGGTGNDLIEGSSGADRMDGGQGNDILRGGAGADRLTGGSEDDRVYGGDGDDVLTESEGLRDALYGGSGNDALELVRQSYSGQPVGSFILDGGDGDDRIRVSPGFSNRSHVDVDAGAGADRVSIEYAAGTTYVRLGSGADTLFLDVLISNGWPGWDVRMLDFAAGDRIDLDDRPLLRQAFGNSDGTTDLFAAGMLRLVPRGGDTYLEGNIRGWGFTPLLVFANKDARSFTASNFSGHQPIVVELAARHEGTAGADDLGGGSGDDVYVVNHAGDTFAEDSYADFDQVRTSLPSYVLPEYVEILSGTSGAGQNLRGNQADNVVTAGAGNDLLRLQDGGSDVASGGAGGDQFYYGAAFDPADANDGGADVDVVVLQGNYAVVTGANGFVNVEYLSLQSGSSTRYGESGANSYSYDIAFVDGNVAAGQRFTINASQLLAGESFTFDGAGETDGQFLIYGGYGADRLTGGFGNDMFHFEGTRWGPNDMVNGGHGADALIIRGSGGMNAIAFGEAQVIGIEAITVSDRFGLGAAGRPSYDLKLANGNVTPGGTLILNGNTLVDAGQAFHVDGSAVLGGSLRLFGGAGGDRMTGGAGDDLFYSAGGQDTLTGGGGRDTFQLRSLADSSMANPDTILDFASGKDLIDLHFLDADVNAAGDQSFSFIGDRSFAGTPGDLRLFVTGSGRWRVEGDVNGDRLADFALEFTADAPAIAVSDFIM